MKITKVMNINDLIKKDNSGALLVVTAADLQEYSRHLIEEARANLNNKEVTPEDKWLSGEEVQQQLKVSGTTLWRWQRCGYLVPTKIGRKPRYRQSDITRILEGKEATDE